MITTSNVKADRFKIFRTGNEDSEEVIFIMGSCRVMPYINYLDYYNRVYAGKRYLIYAIDPFDFNWDKDTNELIDGRTVIEQLENDENFIKIFKSTKIFIHEHYKNFGFFNTFKDGDKTIYQYGMKPDIDISIPNFHDVFILFNDFAKFDPVKSEVEAMNWDLPVDYQLKIVELANANLLRFLETCRKSDLPQMADYFEANYTNKRFFWTFNHISKHFSLKVMQLANEILKFPLTEEFWQEVSKWDMFESTPTQVTKYDINNYGLNWNS